MARRKRPSQRRADKAAERERRKRLRWAAERAAKQSDELIIAEETTFGTQPNPGANVHITLPTAAREAFEQAQAIPRPPSATVADTVNQMAAQVDQNFDTLKLWMNQMQTQAQTLADVICVLNEQLEEQKGRIQDLENAALGKPLEEIT